jgi:hypothetical protein
MGSPLAGDAMDAPGRLLEMVNGYRLSEAVHVTVVLGIPDLLADGPRAVGDLAEASGSDPKTLYRLLRAMAAAGVVEELAERRFAPTEMTRLLVSTTQGSLRPWVENVNRPSLRAAWGGLLDSVVTGRNAFRTVHGTDVWTYREDHPDEGAVFDAAMTALTRSEVRQVVAAYDLTERSTVVDVGGGQGALLAGLLGGNPGLRGVLFDQAHALIDAPSLLAAAGVDDRCDVVAGDFFEAVPEGADVYALKSIIHDWEDEQAVAILANVRAAVAVGGVVLLVERVLAGPNDGLAGKMSDLNMLVAPGGLERTEEEFEELFATAGLRRTRTVPTTGLFSVLEAQAG